VQLLNVVEQLLGAAHRKGWDDDLALQAHRLLQHLEQGLRAIPFPLMPAAAIGAFGDQGVGAAAMERLIQQRHVPPAQVAGEAQGLGLPILFPQQCHLG